MFIGSVSKSCNSAVASRATSLTLSISTRSVGASSLKVGEGTPRAPITFYILTREALIVAESWRIRDAFSELSRLIVVRKLSCAENTIVRVSHGKNILAISKNGRLAIPGTAHGQVAHTSLWVFCTRTQL
jgi:hypothetical protein